MFKVVYVNEYGYDSIVTFEKKEDAESFARTKQYSEVINL